MQGGGQAFDDVFFLFTKIYMYFGGFSMTGLRDKLCMTIFHSGLDEHVYGLS